MLVGKTIDFDRMCTKNCTKRLGNVFEAPGIKRMYNLILLDSRAQKSVTFTNVKFQTE